MIYQNIFKKNLRYPHFNTSTVVVTTMSTTGHNPIPKGFSSLLLKPYIKLLTHSEKLVGGKL